MSSSYPLSGKRFLGSVLGYASNDGALALHVVFCFRLMIHEPIATPLNENITADVLAYVLYWEINVVLNGSEKYFVFKTSTDIV